MATIISILLFLLVLFVLILVHEWGHYFAAKRTGMRVDEFGIGFPPKLFGVRRGETEFTFNALPIGGFVKIYGENGPDETAVSEEPQRAFSARPRWAQAIVLAAGVVMNTLFAWLLFVVILMAGVQSVIPETDYQPETSKLIVTSILPDAPASDAIPAQSIIEGVDSGAATLDRLVPSAFSEFMSVHEGEPVNITYVTKEDAELGTATIVPKLGVIPDNADQAGIGVGLALVDEIKYPFFPALVEAANQTGQSLLAITKGLGSLIGGLFTGTADLSQVTGPVGIVGYVGDAAAFGLVALLHFMAIISLNLAVINLLPIPALDGGRLIFVGIEALIRRPIDPVWAARANMAGFAALMLLMLLVTVNDVMRIW